MSDIKDGAYFRYKMQEVDPSNYNADVLPWKKAIADATGVIADFAFIGAFDDEKLSIKFFGSMSIDQRAQAVSGLLMSACDLFGQGHELADKLLKVFEDEGLIIKN